LIERPFDKYGVEGICGSLVLNRELCLKIISHGGGAREIFNRGCLRKVFLPLRKRSTF